MFKIDNLFESDNLPTLSKVASDLIVTMANKDVTVDAVRDLICKDPVLCAKLLRLANSAYFGLPRGVCTIEDAIAMVGLEQVRALTLAESLSSTFLPIPGFDQQKFWSNSMACAGYAQWLAGGLGMDTQQAWLTGMMLRLGELLIGLTQPATLIALEALPQEPGERWAHERRLVGFTEGQICAELSRRWNFPMQIVQALQRSATPLTEQAFSRLGAIIHLASLLADSPVIGITALDKLPEDVISILKIDRLWMTKTFPDPTLFINLSTT
jgi:HD-like signal output (HDOD) protein